MANQSGIAVSIKGFIPIDPSDFKAHRDTIEAVMKAEAGELNALGPVGLKIEEFRATPVSRRSKADETQPET